MGVKKGKFKCAFCFERFQRSVGEMRCPLCGGDLKIPADIIERFPVEKDGVCWAKDGLYGVEIDTKDNGVRMINADLVRSKDEVTVSNFQRLCRYYHPDRVWEIMNGWAHHDEQVGLIEEDPAETLRYELAQYREKVLEAVDSDNGEYCVSALMIANSAISREERERLKGGLDSRGLMSAVGYRNSNHRSYRMYADAIKRGYVPRWRYGDAYFGEPSGAYVDRLLEVYETQTYRAPRPISVDAIREHIELVGVTQAALAKATGVTTRTVRVWLQKGGELTGTQAAAVRAVLGDNI